MLTLLVVCSFGLGPDQSSHAFGWEIVVASSIAAMQGIWALVGKRQPNDPIRWTLGSLPLLFIPTLTLLGGGVSLLSNGGGGLYWTLFGTALVFVAALINAWVLLVEILR